MPARPSTKNNHSRKLASTVQSQKLRALQTVIWNATEDTMHEARARERRQALKIVEGIVEDWCNKLLVDSEEEESPHSFVASGKKKTKKKKASKKANVWEKPLSVVTRDSLKLAKPAIVPFGSYRLGVDFDDSDLDLLVLAPPNISSDIFFNAFPEVLKKDGRCQHIHTIAEAHVPVIKFEIQTVEVSVMIDLVFVRLAKPGKLLDYHRHRKKAMAVYYEIDDSDLEDLNEKSVRVLNGARVSQMILESMKGKEMVFRPFLKAVRLWAKQCGLYSNALGFLGGVNCAILAAYICQTYPECQSQSFSAELLLKFFQIFAVWEANKPVSLKNGFNVTPPIVDVSQQKPAEHLNAWHPEKDAHHVFPILTPAYPTKNAAFNMGWPQFRRIQEEMFRTFNELCSPSGNYQLVFEQRDVFRLCNRFVQVKLSAKSHEHLIEWHRFVNSKLRHLFQGLERPDEVQAWPDARYFRCEENSEFHLYYYIGVRYTPRFRSKIVDISLLWDDFLYHVNLNNDRKEDMKLDVACVVKDEIRFVQHEAKKELCHDDLVATVSENEDEAENNPKKMRF